MPSSDEEKSERRFEGIEPSLEWIDVNDLTVDPRVQRLTMRSSKVQRMVNNYNPDALGVLTVSRRKDRSIAVIDGQHRAEAIRRRTNGTGKALCHVYDGLTLEQEARMFLDLNEMERVSLFDKYRVAVNAGDERACAIDSLVRAQGLVVSNVIGDGNINAVKALYKLHDNSLAKERDTHLITLALKAIVGAWGTDRHGLQAPILLGVGRLIEEREHRIKLDVLIDRMRSYRGGAIGLMTSAGSLAILRKVTQAMAVADILTEEYNRGARGSGPNALPRWDKRK